MITRTVPEDPRQDQAFFGREEEFYELLSNLQSGRHTLLVGERGIGKSRLMLEARKVLSGRKRRIDCSPRMISQLQGKLVLPVNPDQYHIIALEHASPPGDVVKEIAEQLYRHGNLKIPVEGESDGWAAVRKLLAGPGGAKLRPAILEGIARSQRPYLLFFDSLDRLSPGQHALFESLMSIAVVCAAVTQIKTQLVFKRIWTSFATIELEALPESACLLLIDHCLDTYPIRVIDRELYRREVLKAANGNPYQIKNLIWHGTRANRLEAEDIRSLRRIEQGAFFNMGPAYIFVAGGFTLFKIFSLGTDNREFYIYFSALGFLVFMIFRIFRAFFLFRPQRGEK
jgi:hypothetical protein